MKIRSTLTPYAASALLFSCLTGALHATPATVTDVTDWSTTPNEVVNANLPTLNYSGGVYAGINTLAVTINGVTTIDNGFCIDPFHWSVGGAQSYSEVALVNAPKAPATLNAATATDIEDLWSEFYSPTMSSTSAAGLQIAIWELVSSNAIATDGLPSAEGFSLTSGNDYGAASDLATLANYSGPAANLLGLTGPGQDYVIAGPKNNITPSAPEQANTWMLLALTMGVMAAARTLAVNNTPRLQRVRVQAN